VLAAVADGDNTSGGIANYTHFESICREYAIAADTGVFGSVPGEAGKGVIADPGNRTQIEVDVVVLAPAEPGRPRAVLSLGEARWDRVMDLRHVQRLRRARDLLAVKGFETSGCLLTWYSGAGFSPELLAARDPDIHPIGLGQIYAN
jgi:hypothetical protein